MPENKQLFVISPIGALGSEERKHADMLLHSIIEPVANQFQYDVSRADKVERPGMITEQIITSIIESDVCIVDMSFLNPNVFYEMGLRHYVSKPVVHIARQGTTLPFDNMGFRAFFFDLHDWHSQENVRNSIRNALSEINSDDYRVSNPVTQANAIIEIERSAEPKDEYLRSIEVRLSAVEGGLSGRGIDEGYSSAHIPNAFSKISPKSYLDKVHVVDLKNIKYSEYMYLKSASESQGFGLDFADLRLELKHHAPSVLQPLENVFTDVDYVAILIKNSVIEFRGVIPF